MIGDFLSGPAAGFRHHQLNICTSTNTECLNASENFDPGNLWITARTQTAARGSRGRSWASEPGNLFASLLLVNPGDVKHLAELTFVASVAVSRAVCDVIGEDSQHSIGLKWPNDVLLNGKKVAGILLESHSGALPTKVVVGVGVNCSSSPENVIYPATSISACGNDVELLDFFYIMANHFADTLSLWDRGENFSSIRQIWLRSAAGLGKPVEVRLENQGSVSGVFEAIDDNGHMLIRSADGEIRQISVGDVFFQAETVAGERNE